MNAFCPLLCSQHLEYPDIFGGSTNTCWMNVLASSIVSLSSLSTTAPLPPCFLRWYKIIPCLKSFPYSTEFQLPSKTNMAFQITVSTYPPVPSPVTMLLGAKPIRGSQFPAFFGFSPSICSLLCLKCLALLFPCKYPLDSSMSSTNLCPVSQEPFLRLSSQKHFVCSPSSPPPYSAKYCYHHRPVLLPVKLNQVPYFILLRDWHKADSQQVS